MTIYIVSYTLCCLTTAVFAGFVFALEPHILQRKIKSSIHVKSLVSVDNNYVN